MRAIIATVLAVCLMFPATVAAYDYDQGWVRKTIRPGHTHSRTVGEHEHRFHQRQLHQRKKVHHHYHGYGRSRPRPRQEVIIIEKDRHHDRHHDKDKWSRDRDEALERARGGQIRDRDYARQERVFGYVKYGPDLQDRDILSNIGCLPAQAAISTRDYRQEEDAWTSAQRAWEGEIAWRFGQRFANAANAHKPTLSRICNKTSVAESALDKVVEGVSRAVGGDGYKIKCEMRAQPCPPKEERSPAVRE